MSIVCIQYDVTMSALQLPTGMKKTAKGPPYIANNFFHFPGGTHYHYDYALPL